MNRSTPRISTASAVRVCQGMPIGGVAAFENVMNSQKDLVGKCVRLVPLACLKG